MLSKIDKSQALFIVAAVVFFWIGGLFTTLAPPFMDESWTRPTEGLKDYAALAADGDEEAAMIMRGRDIYVREGCWYCHTQQTRTIEADTVRSGWRDERSPVSTPDEFVYDPPHMFGTRRVGARPLPGRRQVRPPVARLALPRPAQPGARLGDAALPLDRVRRGGAGGADRLRSEPRAGQGLAPGPATTRSSRSVEDYTYPSVVWMYSLMGLFVVGAVFFLVKALRSGAVSSDEAPKYRMLEDD